MDSSRIEVVVLHGKYPMFNIDSKELGFSYACIDGMYLIEGQKRCGEGLQVDRLQDEDALRLLSREISEAIRKYLTKPAEGVE